MKNVLKSLSILSILSMLLFTVSCSDDDGGIDTGGGGDGLLVADGFYPAKTGEDPQAVQQLVTENVEAPDFQSMSRDGYIKAYVYLTAGDYNLVEVASGEIVNTYGGTSSTVNAETVAGGDAADRNGECDPDNSSFTLVDAAVDGAAFNIPSDGLYVMGYDATTGEIVYDEITSAGVIGGATPGGWSADTDMTETSLNASGGAWEVTGVAIEEGEWKFRFNCRWGINRLIDPTAAFDNANGYLMFTNFAGVDGNIGNLVPGNDGANLNNTERGEYTVNLMWDPVSGFTASATKTGDLEPLPDFPEAIYLVGDATAYGWPPSDNNTPSHNDDAVMHKVPDQLGFFWKIASLTGGGGFKLAGDGWTNPNLGFAEVNVDANGVALSDNGGNLSVADDGIYMIVLDMSVTDVFNISVVEAEVYGIGDTYGSFDAAVAAQKYTIDFANKSMTSPAFTGSGDIRIYTSHPWISDTSDNDGDPNWWHGEFVPMSGVIEYRNDGGDQDRVAGTAGQVVTLFFDDNTATVE